MKSNFRILPEMGGPTLAIRHPQALFQNRYVSMCINPYEIFQYLLSYNLLFSADELSPSMSIHVWLLEYPSVFRFP